MVSRGMQFTRDLIEAFKKPMPEEPLTTTIAISCDNEALRPLWREVEDQLRLILYRVGWDTLRCTVKLKEIHSALRQIRDLTVDMNKPLSKRYK